MLTRTAKINCSSTDATSSTATTVTLLTNTEPLTSESPATKKLRKENELSIKHKLVKELFQERAKKGTKVMGLIVSLVNKYKKAGHQYITEDSIKHYIKKMKNAPASAYLCASTVPTPDETVPVVTVDVLDDNNNESNVSSISNDGSIGRNKGGRPLGSSEELKAANIRAKALATTECSVLYMEAQEKARSAGFVNLKRGTLSKLVKEMEDKYGLLHGTIHGETIAKRVYRGNVSGYKYQSTSPVSQLEPLLVDYCIRLCKMGKALDKKQVMLLANSLIEKNEMELLVINWKKSQGMYDESKPLLGKKWYQSFIKRNKSMIKRGRCRIQDVHRKSWCTYDHFEAMYADVYDTMVKAGVASVLEEEVSLDREGNIVDDDSPDKYGRKTKYIMKHPEWVLFADETGCNTNQKEDGLRGGQLFVLENGYEEGGLTGATTDIHFTVMCFTCATGEPVLCVIILKSEQNVKDIPLNWKWGIDITKTADVTGKCSAELFEDNCSEDGVICGGPKCTFRGKELPCFIGSSKKASITSQMLADILAYIDEIGLYDRSTGKKPFLLIDGHHSRFGLPFLDYIFDEANPWLVSIGVPYGTHIWQVADSAQQNALFKKLLSEAKARWLEYRPLNLQKFMPTDIVPLVKQAWDNSFGHCGNSKNAITSRGWNPLNYNLLDNKRLIKTKQNINNKPSSVNNIDAIDPLSLNTSVGAAGSYTDIIVEHTRRDEARMEGNRKKRLEKIKNYKNVESISKIVSMRSGGMATTGNFTFLPEHRDMAKKKLVAQDIEKAAKKQRTGEVTKKLTLAYDTAVGKSMCQAELTADDYRALLKKHYVRTNNDSPLKKTKPQLKTQWQRRKQKYNIRFGGLNDYDEEETAINTNESGFNYVPVPAPATLNTETILLRDIESRTDFPLPNDGGYNEINGSDCVVDASNICVLGDDLIFMANVDENLSDKDRKNNLFSM